MAGSSMDGLDLGLVRFQKLDHHWTYDLKKSGTVVYPESLRKKLADAPAYTHNQQEALDLIFGEWIGDEINKFTEKCRVDLLAIHGHTILHDPDKGRSWQLGDGHCIACRTGIATVTDFRSADIKLGGQGAPLVPFGDFELFSSYHACLNLGGIANISLRDLKLAGDIAPCNQVFNFYAQQLGHRFDNEGQLARLGTIDHQFINSLKTIPFFDQPFPKSLPNQFIPEKLLRRVAPKDGLKSYAYFLSSCLKKVPRGTTVMQTRGENPRMLITGGGAYNTFLMEELKTTLPQWDLQVPSPLIIDFKEAIIFAFLGLKKQRAEINVLASCTGASADSCSGEIHFPND